MAQDMLTARQMGPAKGVDESEHPAAGTVAEAWNVETCDGTWRARGGFTDWIPNAWEADWPARVLAEYIPDFRYEGSHYHALISGGGRYNYWHEYIGDSITAVDLSGHGQAAHRQQYTWVQGLWRYVANDADVKYTTALLITNGQGPPFIYHQKASTNRGTVAPLDAIDGLSGISYLKTPPQGRLVEVYKDRFFMGNISGGAGNRLQWSGPDSGLAFPMNCWPVSNNMDVGDAPELTALKAWKEWLVVFKDDGVWALSGDGVGGVWNVQKISSNAGEGAISCRAVCDIGDAIVFYNARGVWIWSGGRIRNISHPRLQKTWRKLNWNTYSASDGYTDKVFQVLHDQDRRRVMISAATLGDSNDLLLIYNYANDSWDIWGGGHWDNLYIDEGTYSYGPDTVKDFASFGAEVKQFFGDGPKIVFMRSGYAVTYDRWMPFEEAFTNVADISWKIRTHPLMDDENFKVARTVIVDAKTGDQNINLLVIADGETVETAFRKNATAYNIIADHIKALEHDVAGTSYFQSVAAGPVNIWFLPYLSLRAGSVALATASGTNKIKFTSSVDLSNAITVQPGDYMVLPVDQEALKIVAFGTVNSNRVWGTATWDNAEIPRLQYVRTPVNVNTTGRKFSVYITNVGGDTGSYGTIASSTDYSTRVPEIKGWELWARAIASRRGGVNSANPSFN